MVEIKMPEDVTMPIAKINRIFLLSLILYFGLGLLWIGLEQPLTVQAAPSHQKVYPADETANDLSFMEFKLNLLKAIKAKDTDFILAMITPETKLSFGEDHGREGLERLWGLPSNKNSGFWNVMEHILKLGCVQTKGPNGVWFYAPYTYTNFKGEDSFSALIVTGHDVNLRQKPDPNSRILEKLDYDTVLIANPQKYSVYQSWPKVISPSGRCGYVSRKYLISPVDYRAGFTKVNDQWKMLFFVNGD